jgi:cytochrome c oxidase subunit 2
MALYVVAHDDAAYTRWRDNERTSAAEPRDDRTARGRSIFDERCGVCHTVRGTGARGELGPDLTHVAGRLSLGAGILRNDFDNMKAWIRSSQHIKPENLMPSMDVFSADDLDAVAAYVLSLR